MFYNAKGRLLQAYL